MKLSTTITATGIALAWSISSYSVTISNQIAHPYDCASCEHLSHDALSTHWPIQANQLGHETLHQQISKKYSVNTTFKEIEKGVDLYTEAPGAVIRISTVASPNKHHATPAFKPTFFIKTKKSGLLQLNQASRLIATDDELKHSYFAKDTPVILQLKPELGAGKITLSASPTPGHEDLQYIVHVFDKNAESYLTVETNKAMYHYVDQLTTTITLGDNVSHYPLDSVKASFVNPEGDIIPLTLKQNADNRYSATTSLKSTKNSVGDNWYVEAETVANQQGNLINRQAHTAFTYAIPSAVINEINQADSSPFTFTATIDVATASRYALEAVLFRTDEKGNKIPLEVAQSASWLTPGVQQITFSFAPEDTNTATGQFYVSAVQLIDYGQIKPVFGYDGFIPVRGCPESSCLQLAKQ